MFLPYKKRPKNYSYDKWLQYEKIIASFTALGIKEELQQIILEALHDEITWDWYENCNGANFVTEPCWIGIYSPAYIVHDYLWERDGATMESNKLMREIQDAYGMSSIRSWIRWTGVSFYSPIYNFIEWF